MNDTTSVRVALRIRPQLSKERLDMCQVCTSVTADEPQVRLGSDKAFTFDHVLDMDLEQLCVYEVCANSLIEGTFEGYNATIFAYGQTGSGKTYTMGSGFEMELPTEKEGIIPRAVGHLFDGIDLRRKAAIDVGLPPPEFKVNAQFMELYNEEVIDLLDTTRDSSDRSQKSHIRIHEDAAGEIYTVGVTTRPVASCSETMQCLKLGALSRTTASTNMNATSSRSHAIFTLRIKQQRIVQNDNTDDNDTDTATPAASGDMPNNEFETLTAKFHFVDLAGSERLKRTGATGERAKEGISINCGLLALGNVISALGDKTKRGSHVPYRDSKLTRLLQDSLGGNSRTVMIACISPSDRDFMETLNTLKYANRARNIQNKVSVNQDKTSKQISMLRDDLKRLQMELLEYQSGKRLMDPDGVEYVNDMFHENTMLQSENEKLRQRIRVLQESIEGLKTKNTQLLAEKAIASIQNINGDSNEVAPLIEGYIIEIEDLRVKLLESEALVAQLKRSGSNVSSSSSSSYMSKSMSEAHDVNELISIARKDIHSLKRTASSREPSTGTGASDPSMTGATRSEELVSTSSMVSSLTLGDDDTEANDISSSESESEEVEAHLHANLADLQCEISIKEKLVEELERSQKRLLNMRHQYEEKLISLQCKINETEMERDRMLSQMDSAGKESDDKSSKIKEQYKSKIIAMQEELKRLQSAQKEHTKLLRNQSQYERQLRTLQKDLHDMKCSKVKLMSQIKVESQKHRQNELQRRREMEKMKKEHRLKDSQISKLQSEKKQKEVVLKRKQEEVESLRRKNTKAPMSHKTAGRIGKYDKQVTVPINPIAERSAMRYKSFSPKVAKQKWDTLEKTVNTTIVKKQTLTFMERDMERWLKQREVIGKKYDKFIRRKEKALAEERPEDVLQEIDDQIKTLTHNLTYVQDNINDCQNNIVQLEETRETDVDPVSHIQMVSNLDEARYLLSHLMNLVITKGLCVTQQENENRELLAKLHQEKMDSTFQRDMLQYLIKDKSDPELDIDYSMIRERNEVEEDEEDDSNSSADSSASSLFDRPLGEFTSSHVVPSNSSGGEIRESLSSRQLKARRRAATPQDLLGGMFAPVLNATLSVGKADATPVTSPTAAVPSSNLTPLPEDTYPSGARSKTSLTSGHQIEFNRSAPMRTSGRSLRPPAIRQSSSEKLKPAAQRQVSSEKPKPPPNSSEDQKICSEGNVMTSSISETSCNMRRKLPAVSTMPATSCEGEANNQNSLENSSPFSSPQPSRRANVFKRLTNNGISASPAIPRGSINEAGEINSSLPLIHSHTAQGHTKPVLSVFATEDLLFSSSKDRTCKIWDLNTGAEFLTLGGHLNNVVSVRYSEYTKLVYTVSSYMVRVWDIREGARNVVTLMSSGLSEANPITPVTGRQVTCPSGENSISDVALSSNGNLMFSAAANSVRLWDLREFKQVGRLAAGHQAAVMVLALDDMDTAEGNICLVTGSKDHYIKVFDIDEDAAGVISPKFTLDPPHYDGVQSLCVMGDLLFSGSRDMCIKKWDLAEQKLKFSINNSHKDWICGLSFLPDANCLLSCCRGGFLKLWHIDSCQMIAEIAAHNSPINAVTTNSHLVFTASNDNTVKVWQPCASELPDDYEDYLPATAES